ncbi:MAG: hypothetical protein IJX30_03215 [Clostridia bacterium]|nr:hypothetical protein [Clostridia bacterium]
MADKTAEKRAVYIPKTGKGDEFQFVAVNGESLYVKKGVSVELPQRFAEVIDNMLACLEAADEAEEQMQID